MNSETLISASIQGGILAGIVWLLVQVMPSLPPAAKVWLWRIVFLKFALGFAGVANVPLHVLPAAAPVVVSQPLEAEPAIALNAVDATQLVSSSPSRSPFP